MFNIFSQDKNNQLQSYLDVIMLDSTKLHLSKLAIEKAVGMIANAIAKSEIVIQTKTGRRKDKEYYRLNVRPNDNETGTDFWRRVVTKMLTEEKCRIVRTEVGKYYIVSSCTESTNVFQPKQYSSVIVECDGNSVPLNKTFSADQMIVLKYENDKIRNYLNNVVQLYDKTLNALNYIKTLSNTPKYKFKIDANLTLREKNADGTERVVTKDEYKNKVKALISSEDISLITLSQGMELDSMKFETNTTSEDIVKIAKEVNSECSRAFDIPEAVFFGNITEKSDATNEFITYAVSPPAEVINDSLNAKLVGMDDYVKGERVFIWLARYKHVDVIDSANSLDKLRGIGFTLDEIFEMVGYPALNTEFSTKRALTKNYSVEGERDDSNGN